MSKNFLLLVFLGVFILTGCNPIFYTPTSQNVPLFSEKGEIRATAMGNPTQAEIHGAYAATDHIGIQLNGGYFFPERNDQGEGGSGKLVELGVGYFTPIGESKFIFETYALAGGGVVENNFHTSSTVYPGTTGKLNANLFRVGLQPSIGFKTKHFSAALSSRFVNLSYANIDGSLVHENINQQQYLRDNNSMFLIEPALTLRGGFERVQLQFQFVTSMNLSNSNFQQEHSAITLGLHFNLNK